MGYRTSVERNGQGWHVTVHGVEGLPVELPVQELVEVEYRTRHLIWGYLGGDLDGVEVDLHLELPRSVEVCLEMAEGLAEDATAEADRAIAELVEAGVSVRDIGWILERRWAARRVGVGEA